MVDLGFFLKTLTAYQPTGNETAVSSVVMDSRDAEAGSLFVAEPGEGSVNGHAFVTDAFARGAVAALINQPVDGDHVTLDLRSGNPVTCPDTKKPICLLVNDAVGALQETAAAWVKQYSPTVVGITGSVGKTSTKELTHAVLSARFNTFRSAGNRNSILGLPLTVFDIRPFHQVAVLEMAMYTKGEIARLAELFPPKIGIVTLVAAVHIERAGSIQAITEAKRELVEALPSDGVAILNRDDPRVMSMVDFTDARIFTYGLHDTADLWADNIVSLGMDGVRFTLHHAGESLHVKVPLLGRHSVHTSLRAAAAGLALGLTWDEIVAGLRTSPAQLRIVTVPGPRNSTIIDDTYNANPESMKAALNLLADLPGRRIAVLGDMAELGHVEEESHRLIGRRAADIAGILVAVGPRARWFGEEASIVGMSPDQIHYAPDAETAVSVIESLIEPEDIVLVKGSYAMRMDRIVTQLGRYD
jgi:UDP-N-acetylmuramoyl-tripeptide--D-alanyl-D-alanine ligase